MFCSGNHIQEGSARFQDPQKFFQCQRGEAVEQNIYAFVGDRQMIGGGNSEFNFFFPLCCVTENELRDVCTGHPGGFSGGQQGMVNAGSIVSISAAGIQQDGGVIGAGQNLLAECVQQRCIVTLGEKVLPGGGHALVITGSCRMLLVGREQIGIALFGDIIAVPV
jgi:hypothetical protein